MSNVIQNLCWPLKMRPARKSVLTYLATRADDEGCCWPPITNIEEATCFKSTAVMKALRELEASGLVEIDRSRRNNTYYLQVDKLRDAYECAQRTKREERKESRRGPTPSRRGATKVRTPDPKGPPSGSHTSTLPINTTQTQEPDLFERFKRYAANTEAAAAKSSGQRSVAGSSGSGSISAERAAFRRGLER